MLKNLAEFIFGAKLDRRLPDRVSHSIAEQQIKSEILIGWVQLTLVLFFGTLYTIAPKTSAGTGFTPVPWALALYFLFTVLRLVASYRHFVPRWLLMASVVMDMGLLMLLIWSFHLQYEQPPSFYLKAPTMLYVFIFIALRALRFDASYIMFAGATAAVGWLALILYVLYAVPDDPMITRDYVEYLTSNSILVGAEIDKIVSILLVTGVLAIALRRAERMLSKAVLDNTTAHDLSRFVAPEVADRIATADEEIQPGDGEVKEASILFTDIEKFSTISEKLGPDELMRTLNEYFAQVSAVIDRFGGVITQFEGDAMLITFNTAKSDPDHAANAVRTAAGIQDVVMGNTFGEGIQMRTRCGINTGQLVAGAVGTHDRLLFTVHGDEVNIAARLEQLNKEHGTYVLVSESTVAEAGGDFTFERIGEIIVRGRTTPTAVYALAA